MKKPEKVAVVCPRCGHNQQVPRAAYSSVCRNCSEHLRVQELLQPAARTEKAIIPSRQIRCFRCGTELQVSAAAESTMCKRCSVHLDLRDYDIGQAVSKNFRTKGKLVIEEKGFLFNSESIVGAAVIKGKFLGKLMAETTLELHSTAQIRGSFTSGCLVVPSGQRFFWPEPLRMGGAEIAGELVGSLQLRGTLWLRATARLFGNVVAPNLVVEAGAIIVGSVTTGKGMKEASEDEVSSEANLAAL